MGGCSLCGNILTDILTGISFGDSKSSQVDKLRLIITSVNARIFELLVFEEYEYLGLHE